jgi:hypothetical protein
MVKWLIALLALLTPTLTWAQTPPIPSSTIQILQTDASANGTGFYMPVAGYSIVGVTISVTSGSPTFLVNFEGAAYEGPVPQTPNQYFQLIACVNATNGGTASSAGGAAHYRCNVSGMTVFRARISGYSGSGAVRVVGAAIAGGIAEIQSPAGLLSTLPSTAILYTNGFGGLTASTNLLFTNGNQVTVMGAVPQVVLQGTEGSARVGQIAESGGNLLFAEGGVATRLTVSLANGLMTLTGPLAPVPFIFTNIATALTANGQVGYCSDCTIANPCAGSGNGAIAKRLNGINVCN